jgi:hypothetical protein
MKFVGGKGFEKMTEKEESQSPQASALDMSDRSEAVTCCEGQRQNNVR